MVAAALALAASAGMMGCAGSGGSGGGEERAAGVAEERMSDADGADGTAGGLGESVHEPPAAVRAWMDRLTVPHRYDPATGFIVAEEVTALPGVFAAGDKVEPAVARALANGATLLVVATADRCGPCQQYKLDALNDPRVIERLERGAASGRVVAVHVEVDRQPELAERLVGSLAIPMTYAVRGGERVGVLRGQRSAEDLLAFLESVERTGDGAASGA